TRFSRDWSSDVCSSDLHDDEVWRLPLHEPYGEWLKSPIADTNNAHGNAFAGASVAALFLDKFVGEDIVWAHLDTFAWRPAARPEIGRASCRESVESAEG